MNAIPVINPATVIGVFQAGATDPHSMKKKALAANKPNETPMSSPPVDIATKVITRVFCIPHKTRVRTSLPFISVPAQ